jgi:GntP family gluconate:H+ symporter
MPIILPVVMISANTVFKTLAAREGAGAGVIRVQQITAIVGDANLAMLMAAAIAIIVLWRQRRPGRDELAKLIESSLMSGGVIILITSAGGAFGKMLQEAQIRDAITGLIVGEGAGPISGVPMLFIAFLVAFLIKVAQGSSTVAMITASGILAPLIVSGEALGFHPVYVATSIGFGAQCGNWMNDSGFWIFAKMSGLTEVETLKTWTVTVSSLAIIGFGFSVLFAKILPLV